MIPVYVTTRLADHRKQTSARIHAVESGDPSANALVSYCGRLFAATDIVSRSALRHGKACRSCCDAIVKQRESVERGEG